MAKKILVVDDEADMVDVISERLKANGYEVVPAYDGQEALDKVYAQPPDLIILDLMLPVRDGYQVCRLLKFDAKYRHIPVIMLTARTQKADKIMGQEVGAEAYITKPFEAKDLLAKVKELLGG